MKRKYEMAVEKPQQMDNEHMLQLKNIYLAPYMQIATALIGKARFAGGNMFRHQLDTMSILIDYGYIDNILLKASCVHDTIEDIPGFDENLIRNADSDGPEVLELVKEVTKRFENDRAAARGEMNPRALIVFKHDSPLGNARAGQLFDLVRVRLKEGVEFPRSFDDYEVKRPSKEDLKNSYSGVTIEELI